MMSLILGHGKHCTPCSAKFSVTLQAEILSTEPSDFLKQIIFSRHLVQCLQYIKLQTQSCVKIGHILSV